MLLAEEIFAFTLGQYEQLWSREYYFKGGDSSEEACAWWIGSERKRGAQQLRRTIITSLEGNMLKIVGHNTSWIYVGLVSDKCFKIIQLLGALFFL